MWKLGGSWNKKQSMSAKELKYLDYIEMKGTASGHFLSWTFKRQGELFHSHGQYKADYFQDVMAEYKISMSESRALEDINTLLQNDSYKPVIITIEGKNLPEVGEQLSFNFNKEQ